MTRRVVLWALVAVLPFSGMRVMCIDPPAAATSSIERADETSATGHAEHTSECDRLCPLPRRSANDDRDCALTVDGSLLIMVAGGAVFPIQEPPRAPATARHRFSDPPQLYLEPGLARLNPPPKA